jgi:hypothetical protein
MSEKEEKKVLTETLGHLRLSKKDLEKQIGSLKEQGELQLSINSQQKNDIEAKTERLLSLESRLSAQQEQIEYSVRLPKGK